MCQANVYDIFLRNYCMATENWKTGDSIFLLPLNILNILVCVNTNTFVNLFK